LFWIGTNSPSLPILQHCFVSHSFLCRSPSMLAQKTWGLLLELHCRMLHSKFTNKQTNKQTNNRTTTFPRDTTRRWALTALCPARLVFAHEGKQCSTTIFERETMFGLSHYTRAA
jgi:hypothetical protein